jgi:hypothetical protein
LRQEIFHSDAPKAVSRLSHARDRVIATKYLHRHCTTHCLPPPLCHPISAHRTPRTVASSLSSAGMNTRQVSQVAHHFSIVMK